MNMCLGWSFDNAQDLVRVLMLLSPPGLCRALLYLFPPHPNMYLIPRADCEKMSDGIPSGVQPSGYNNCRN